MVLTRCYSASLGSLGIKMKERVWNTKLPPRRLHTTFAGLSPWPPKENPTQHEDTADTGFQGLLSCGTDPFYFTGPVSLSTEHTVQPIAQ